MEIADNAETTQNTKPAPAPVPVPVQTMIPQCDHLPHPSSVQSFFLGTASNFRNTFCKIVSRTKKLIRCVCVCVCLCVCMCTYVYVCVYV